MIKKISAILLGFMLIVSAFLINGNASVNYAQLLEKKISEDKTLRRFSGGMRRGTSNSYQKPTTKKKTLSRRYGYVRPRITKTAAEIKATKTKEALPMRKTSFASTTFKTVKHAPNQKLKNISFNNKLETKTVNTENFVLETDATLLEQDSSESLVLKNSQNIQLLIKKIPAVSTDVSFENLARSIAEKELATNLETSSVDQAKKLVSQVRKNQIGINQTPPTNFFEKTSWIEKYGETISAVQRIQEDPIEGFYYLEVSGPGKLIKSIMNIANTSFSTFNLK